MTHHRPLTLPGRCRLAASGASEPRYELWMEAAAELERAEAKCRDNAAELAVTAADRDNWRGECERLEREVKRLEEAYENDV